MKSRYLGYLVALVVFALDQLAKWLVTGPLGVNQVGDQLYLLAFFQLTYTQNIGISLGLLNATTDVGRWMLVALTLAIAIGVAVWMGREKNRVDQAALGMVLGGAMGNILDRTLHGYVVDFADLQPGAAGGGHRRNHAGRSPAAGDRRAVRRPRAAQPGRNQPARRGRPQRCPARHPQPGVGPRYAAGRQGADDGPDPDRRQCPDQRRFGPDRPIRSKSPRMAETNVPARLVEIESMLDRSRRRFEEGTKLVEEAHKLLADVQQAILGSPRSVSPEDSEEAASKLLASLKASGSEMPETLCGGRLSVDQLQRLIRIDGHPIGITEMEYRVLELLAFARNNVVTRAMLLKHLYRRSDDQPQPKIIDVFISKLRKKLRNASGGAEFIETIPQRGWILRDIDAKSGV